MKDIGHGFCDLGSGAMSGLLIMILPKKGIQMGVVVRVMLMNY